MSRRRTTALALVVVLAFGATACASSAGEGEGATAPTSTMRGTSTTTAAPSVRRSPGCGQAPPAVERVGEARPGDVPQSIRSGGVERTYRLGIPAGYREDEPVPLVLDLHGSGSNALQQSAYSDLPRAAAKRGWITVTPDAIDGRWQLVPTGTDDAFLTELVDHVAGELCVDLDRVHVAGISLGSWKASLMACQHPDRFASAVLVAEEVWPKGCPPTAVLAFHGTADPVVPYGEGTDPGVTVTGNNAGLPGTRGNVASWAKAAGCDPTPAIRRIGSDVERWTYRGCTAGTDVVLYSIRGGGHTWPGSDITVGPTTQTIDATDLALDFMAAHPHRR